MKIWILFSIANEYDQPDKAFEKLFWIKPTMEDLREYGFPEERELTDMNHIWRWDLTRYWIEEFKKENHEPKIT